LNQLLKLQMPFWWMVEIAIHVHHEHI
jgi:hypothetical protein